MSFPGFLIRDDQGGSLHPEDLAVEGMGGVSHSSFLKSGGIAHTLKERYFKLVLMDITSMQHKVCFFQNIAALSFSWYDS